MSKRFFLLIFIFQCSKFLYSQENKLMLHSGWEFRHAVDTDWYPAHVPGCVHLDQMASRIIPDPYLYDNEKNLQWIEEQDWVYRTHFEITDYQLLAYEIELVFEGLDTYADVMLNGLPVLNADNMFRTWAIPVKNSLRPGINTLEIHFSSAVKKGKFLAKILPYTLPGDEKVFTRKAQYQYGWDWGPRYVTTGIWRPVYLNFISGPVFRDIFIRQNKVSYKKADLSLEFNILSDTEEKFTLRVMGASQFRFTLDTVLELKKGPNLIILPISINQPRLWHPYTTPGYENANLTTFHFELEKKKTVLCTRDITTGLRTIELITKKDSIGHSFYFKVNGKPVFIKGANYIPPDNFMSRPDSAYYRRLIEDAKASNINMLRVWGGGTYECNYFYDLCDAMGIMIWQDFMFACAMYPGDTSFLNNVKAEAQDNITRLRHHPCIALWCGNNEINEGWHNWGWQEQFKYSVSDSARIWQDYLKLFERILPDAVHTFDPGVSYWSSSPSIGWGHKEAMKSGDSHYWGVWWGMEPFETYEKKVPRFMSEFGFQGFPHMNTINAFTNPKDRYLGSPELKAHQKHPTGFETIQTYMEREFAVPTTLEDYVYVSQALQAEGIRRAIEAQRRAKPLCMGTLYWQYNDCWPVVSWSSRDYYGRWKALQYAVKQAYEPFLISICQDSLNKTALYLINDLDDNVEGKIEINILDTNGVKIYTRNLKNLVVGTSRNTIIPLDNDEFSKAIWNVCRENCMISATFTDTYHQKNYTARYYFERHKEISKKEAVTAKVLPYPSNPGESGNKEYGTHFSIKLRANTTVRGIWLQTIGADARFSENYFDMIKGEEKIIECSPLDPKNPVDISTFSIRSLTTFGK